jgi:4-hydroxybenzoate polyprenyltransferase
MVVLLAGLVWTSPHLGAVYLSGVVLVALLIGCEHWLVRPDDLSRVNMAFFHVNAVISLGLLFLGLLDLWVSGLLGAS